MDCPNFNRQSAARFIAIALGTLAFAGDAAWAGGQSSPNFIMQRDAVNAGIDTVASPNYRISASIGEGVASASLATVNFQLAGGFRGAVGAPPAILNLLSVVSRKAHNGITFDLDVNSQPLSGSITVESRGSSGAGHVLVFHFDGTVTAKGAATALDAAMNSAATVTLDANGQDVIATLSNVAENKRLTLTLTGVNNSATVARSIGFLLGDANATRRVTAADIAGVKANSGKTINAGNAAAIARYDLNLDGSISSADISAVKARAGVSMQ